MAQRFFVPGSHAVEQQLFLNAERSNYLCRVLRLVRGNQVEIFDGAGNVFACEIVADNPRQTELRVLTQTVTARPRRSHRQYTANHHPHARAERHDQSCRWTV